MATNQPLQNSTETAAEFTEELWSRVYDGFAMVSMAFGAKLGLFDVIAKFDEPKTSWEIAEAAGYKERYVREWLGAMVSSHILNLDESGGRYFIPEHRKKALTEPKLPASFSRMLFAASENSRELEECFRLDGPPGIPDSNYHEFSALLESWAQCFHSPEAIHKRLSLAPGLLEKLERGINACELGTGTGTAAFHIAERFPRSHVLGLDISEEDISRAQAVAKEKGLKNINFQVQDICSMPREWNDKWDLVWGFDVAHDVPYTTQMLQEVLRVLKPGGTFILLEIDVHSEHKDNVDVPFAKCVYSVSLFHCLPVSLYFKGSEGLGAAWGMEKPREVLEDIGFDVIQQENALFICKKTE